MKIVAFVICLFAVSHVNSQGFDCDGSMYLVIYTESIGESVLYKIKESSSGFTYEPIPLSEKRRLTALSYNVLNKHLMALDVDTYELIQIDKRGNVENLGVPESINTDYKYHAGTISPDGSGIFLIAFDEEFGVDKQFYTINLSRENYLAGFLGITGEPADIHDFATDPILGVMYGFDNIQGKLVQIAIGGLVSTLEYPSTGVNDINGLFFNQKGDLFGYSAQNGMYSIDKRNGKTARIGKGPEGTHGDACSCPYTYQFNKIVEPEEIVPCEEFKVTYTYMNRLGIGQTWLDIRDTFPDGFEIMDIESSIVQDFNIILDADPNVLALENVIYLMGENKITLTVQAPEDYTGSFSSQAKQWDFPQAFAQSDEVDYQISDDPNTFLSDDNTTASVLRKEEIEIDAELTFDCEGINAVITSPFAAQEYLWSTGSTDRQIFVSESGWYTLRAQNHCIDLVDSVYVTEFPGPKEVELTGQTTVILGDQMTLTAKLSRGKSVQYTWSYDDQRTVCAQCSNFTFTPIRSDQVSVVVEDDLGCLTEATIDIKVEKIRNLYAPNAFSPNNDGINDLFFLQSSLDGQLIKLEVYNRWGGAIYTQSNVPLNDDTEAWNGLSNGQKVPTGVYVWMAEILYIDGHSETLSGEVAIIAN